jgi:hypothetical protein
MLNGGQSGRQKAAAERRKNAAHGASRGKESETEKPQRGERVFCQKPSVRFSVLGGAALPALRSKLAD